MTKKMTNIQTNKAKVVLHEKKKKKLFREVFLTHSVLNLSDFIKAAE